MRQTALVVEDDHGLQIIYDRILTDLGLEVIHVNNGLDAIQELEDGLHPDYIFLDMLLPGMNGVGVIDFIKENPHLHGIQVFMVSSNSSFQRYVNEIPNAKFVLKPIRPKIIRDLLS